MSAETNHTINGNWYVSGNLQVVTDSSSERTTGNITLYEVEPYAQTSTTGNVSENGDFVVTVAAQRNILIQSEFTSGSGQHTSVTWTQNLEYSNTQYYLDNYMVNVCAQVVCIAYRLTTLACPQNVAQNAKGSFQSTHNGISALSDNFAYPLDINMTYLEENNTYESCECCCNATA